MNTQISDAITSVIRRGLGYAFDILYLKMESMSKCIRSSSSSSARIDNVNPFCHQSSGKCIRYLACGYHVHIPVVNKLCIKPDLVM